jgi:hypothetical protein
MCSLTKEYEPPGKAFIRAEEFFSEDVTALRERTQVGVEELNREIGG